MKKKHVLVVTPSVSRIGGGVSESAKNLAISLVESGCEVQVLTLRDKHTMADSLEWKGVTIRTFKSIGPPRYGFSIGMLWYALFNQGKFDIMHVHGLWMFHCLCSWIYHFRTGCLYVVSPHGMLENWILNRSRIIKFFVSKIYQNKFLNHAFKIHVLTDKEERDVSAFLGSETYCKIIPNFVTSLPQLYGKPLWWTEDMNDKTVYLFLGRIHEKKGWRELLTAWADVCESDPHFLTNSYLIFCGWIDESADFSARVLEHQSRYRNVLFAGPQFGKEKFLAYFNANFFVLPSKSEGLPMSVLEAWDAGLPTIISAACNLGIGFTSGAAIECGETPPSISSALKLASSLSAEELEVLKNSARILSKKNFGKESVTRQFMNLYGFINPRGVEIE